MIKQLISQFETKRQPMKKLNPRINCRFHTIILATLVLLLAPLIAWTDDFAQLKGCWQCQEDGVAATIEFKSRRQLLYNLHFACCDVGFNNLK